MRLPSRGEDRELSTNMTPMIDVVFLLIIFFLVSSHLARQESRIPLELPTAGSHAPSDVQTPSVTINVLADGRWQVGGTDVELSGVAAVLADHRRRDGAGALVRIRTDRSVPYDRVEPLLRESARSGLPNVSIAVYRPTSSGGR